MLGLMGLQIADAAALVAAGMTLLVAAEWLILRMRLFHAGVEEALWTGGILALTAHFVPSSGDWGLAVAVALVLALAAMRLLNPFLLTLAFAAASVAIDLAGGHRVLGEPDVAIAPSVFCYAAGTIALLIARVQFLRPSHDHMLGWLMVIMPLCGFLWLATQHAPAIRVGTGLASGIFALVALIVGIRRSHAPLLACIAALGCVAYQLRDLTTLPLKLKLIVWGSAALLAAMGLDRYLRTPRRGITSLQLSEGTAAMDLVQWVGAGALSPRATPQADAPFKGGGGGFSGGGADGRY